MTRFDDLQQASRAVTVFMMDHGAALNPWTRDKILDAMAQPSPVDNLMPALECLYAVRADLPPEGLDLVGALAEFVTPYGWHGINRDNRGGKIAMAMHRDLGEAGTWPDPADDPEPLERYSPPVLENRKRKDDA